MITEPVAYLLLQGTVVEFMVVDDAGVTVEHRRFTVGDNHIDPSTIDPNRRVGELSYPELRALLNAFETVWIRSTPDENSPEPVKSGDPPRLQ
jgi:hypothetical protein